MKNWQAEAARMFPCRVANTIASAFAAMEVAEEVIAEQKKLHPEHADVVHGAFMFCTPGDTMLGAPVRLYRKHVEQVIGRVRHRAKLAPATDAEVLHLLYRRSLIAPPTHEDWSAQMYLFETLFGTDKMREVMGGETLRPSEIRSAKDRIEDIRHDLRSMTGRTDG
jgi:hypothetical protein